jgi:predicted DNA-binding transcriptional regulator YafY
MNGELRLLIDNVLLTDGLSKNNRIDLIRRLEGLSSKYFHSEISKIDMDIYGQPLNQEVIKTLEDIGNAIVDEKQITFHYCTCDTDCKLHEKLDDNGEPKQYTVNPYQIISRNGHSYLICNLPKYHDLTHFRIDRIKDSQVTATSLTPLRMLKGFENGIRLSEYVKEHPNLWSGNAVHITFQCKQYMMNDVVDSFGTDLRIEKLPDDMIKVHIQVSESAMLHWAIQFADAVEVLSPQSLRKQIAETLRNALEKYKT